MARTATRLLLVLALLAVFAAVALAAAREQTSTDDVANAAPAESADDISADLLKRKSKPGKPDNGKKDKMNGKQKKCVSYIDSRDVLHDQLRDGTAGTLAADAFLLLKSQVAVLNHQISSQGCCQDAVVTDYYVDTYVDAADTSAVCDFLFDTYSAGEQASTCAHGYYHAGSCFGRNTNLRCYSITDLSQRIACISDITNRVGYGTLAGNLLLQPPDATLIATVPPCSPDKLTYRQADGSCNNNGTTVLAPGLPSFYNSRYSGMAGSKFTHLANLNTLGAPDRATYMRGPNPREISSRLFTQSTFIPNPLRANGLAMAWVNFFIHDFMDHTNDDWQNYIAVPIPDDDPIIATLGSSAPSNAQFFMNIQSTSPAVDDTGAGFPVLRNKATAWFDLSQVYGSDSTSASSLRSFSGGLLKMNPTNNNLPDAPAQRWVKKPFLASDSRVHFHPGLTLMHTIWAREHNNIAALLAQAYPTLNDEQLYQTARLIVSREMVKVHTLEWSNQMYTDQADQTVLYGLALNLGPNSRPDQRAALTVPEEFVAMYKWHTWVNPTLTLRDANGNVVQWKGQNSVDYIAQFQDTSLFRDVGATAIAVGLAIDAAGIQRFENLPPKMQNFQHPFLVSKPYTPFHAPTCVVLPVFDSIATDIIRDRERGIPKYNALRTLIGQGELPLANFFDDLAQSKDQAANLADLYQWDINNVDAIVGAHGENMYPNQAFPLTMVATFLPFVLGRVGLDRFHTTEFTATKYTSLGLKRIAVVNFAQILCDTDVTCNIPPAARAAVFQQWDLASVASNTNLLTKSTVPSILAAPIPPLPPVVAAALGLA